MSYAFSHLDGYQFSNDCIDTCIISSMRRSLIYPYIRSWTLSRRVLTDVTKVLLLGKRCIFKMLASIASIVRKVLLALFLLQDMD